jgi:serine/threonine protein kinase
MQQYQSAPKRILTKLADGVRYESRIHEQFISLNVRNDGFDNADGDFICRVSDLIYSPEGVAYEILDKLGHGTFGQVLRCSTSPDRREVAVKIIKNKPAYFQQGLIEVRILQQLNKSFDLRIVKMLDYFVYRRHLCIVFELLSVNLYDVVKHNNFRGLPFTMVRSLVDQLVRCLVCLKMSNILHCDLKPENILLMSKKNTKIKLIDFGSASFFGQQIYTYIQSRFYRSVDVILGIMPFTPAIDMWSLGCIVAELYIGLPVFPGHSEYDQLSKIIELLGPIPKYLLDKSRNTRKFFTTVQIPEAVEDTSPRHSFRLRTREEYEESSGKKERVGKKHIKASSIRELIMSAPLKASTGSDGTVLSDGSMSNEEVIRREKIINFIHLCLEYDPEKRITPAQAVTHPLFDDSIQFNNIDEIINWAPKSDEACIRKLTEDPNSFIHTSSSGLLVNPASKLMDSSGISIDNMISTPVKQPLQPSPAQPLQQRNAQSASIHAIGISGFPDDTMPVSYRPALNQSSIKQRHGTSTTSSPLSKLPPASSISVQGSPAVQQSPATVYRGAAMSTRLPPPGIPFSPNTSKYTSQLESSPGGCQIANGRSRVRAQSSIETELAHRWV